MHDAKQVVGGRMRTIPVQMLPKITRKRKIKSVTRSDCLV